MNAPQLVEAPFVGRRRELRQVTSLLRAGRLVTLVGRGGVGKTRLVRELVARSTADQETDTWCVELAEVTEPALVGPAVATSIGMRPRPGTRQEAAIASLIGDSVALLVLDNCEHVLTEARTIVTVLLSRCPNLSILATSRQTLAIAREQAYEIGPLELPPTDQVTVDDLARYDATSLFLQRAARWAPGFRLTESNAHEVSRVCRALEGLPLALELAAAQVDRMAPERLLSLLGAHEWSTARTNVGQDRHRSLGSSIGWSYDLCTRAERAAWSRFSVFRGGWTFDAAGALCPTDRATLLEVISGLVDKSIVQHDPGAGRYSMPESVRAFGEARLPQDELGECRVRHVTWFAGLAAEAAAAWVGADQVSLQRRLRSDLSNIVLALEESSGRADLGPTAIRMVCDLEFFWLTTGQLSAARRWARLALAHRNSPTEDRVVALSLDAYFAGSQMEFHEAEVALAEARDLADATCGERGHAHLEFADGINRLFQGEATAAVQHFDRSAILFRTAGIRTGELFSNLVLAMSLRETGAHQEATAVGVAGIALCDSLGERNFRSHLQWLLGLGALEAGDLDEATRLQGDALRARGELHDQLGTALSFEAFGAVASKAGESDRAATLLGAASRVWAQIGLNPLAAPYIAAHRDLGERAARNALSDQAFLRAYRRGAQMKHQDAVDYALQPSDPGGGGPIAARVGAALSDRELEVAQLVASGLTNARIANRLAISPRTVEGHLERTLMKLGLTSRTQIAVWLWERSRNPGAAGG